MSQRDTNKDKQKTEAQSSPGSKTVPINRVRIAGYTILREIGQGGMSIVYLAEQKSLKREVAIKVLKKNVANDPEVASRFLHEAKIIAKLDHPHIVSIYEVGHTEDGDPYYSMPYLRYGDLSQASFKFDKDIKHLMFGVCEGLAYSHEHDVIHRDLKPANILFDHFGNAQVADFGIALSRNSKRWTKQEHIIGSACYMSPEQALSKPVTQASDLYSLGTILYEQLTGSPPFVKDDDLSTLVAHINEPVPRLPPEKAHWQPVIDKALAKHPEDRFFNALEFKNAVQQVSPGFTHALGNSFKRHKKIAAGLALLLVGLVASLTFWPTSTPTTADPVELTTHPSNSAANAAQQAAPDRLVPAANHRTEGTPSLPDKLDSLELAEATVPATTNADEDMTGTTSSDETGANSPKSATDTEEPAADTTPRAEDILSGLGSAKLTPKQATTLISAGFQKIKEKRLTRPEGDNAFAYFTEVLSSYPGNKRATQGVQLVFNYYLDKTRAALTAGNDKAAADYAAKLNGLYAQSGLYSTSKTLRDELLHAAEKRITWHQKRYQPGPAETVLAILAQALPDQYPALEALQTRVSAIPRPGQLLKDAKGVSTVFIPGDAASGVGAFGLMPHEVTVAEYARFAKATSRKASRCQHKAVFKPFSSKLWHKPPFKQGPQNPVICVSWEDASAYANWLSEKSRHRYALPDKKHWLSLQRWKTQGNTPCEKGNVAGKETGALRTQGEPWDCRDNHVFTAPVSRFGHNPLGVGGIWGNAAEWVSDCGKVPDNAGKQWLKKFKLVKDKGCPRQYAGNSWLDGKTITPMQTRTTLPGQAFTHVGFRLIRVLD